MGGLPREQRIANLRRGLAEKKARDGGKPPSPKPAPPPSSKDAHLPDKGTYREWSDGRIEAYGARWPQGFGPVEIEASLYAYEAQRKAAPNCLDRHKHFARYLKLIVPETAFAWHRWVYEGVELWCEDWFTCIGAAGTGKSAMFGLFVLGDWLVEPSDTVTVLVSTSLDALKARIYKYVCQWHESVIPQYRVGSFRQANPLGLLHVDPVTEENPQPQWKGAGILCVGFKAGDSTESIKNHLGRHLRRNRIVVDELQGVNPAVLDLWWNMGASGEFKFGGFGNPQSMFDPLASASTPAGHSSRLAAFDWLHRDMMDVGRRRTKTWPTDQGRCLMLDGRESPGVDDPAKFHYLIGQKHIDAAKKSGGENSVQWYAFICGIFPPSGGANTLLSAKEVKEGKAEERGVSWEGNWEDWIFGDLAHSGEDEKVIQRARVGKAVGGAWMIDLMEREYIQIDEKAGFISQQIGRFVATKAKLWGVPVNRVAIDATATQGAMIDAVEQAMGGRGVVRIHAAGPPSNNAVKLGWPQMCKEAYADRAAELAGNLAEFVRAGQIRGMDSILAQQCVSRVVLPQEENQGKLKLDPDKRGNNGGKSPNEFDALCVGVTALREKAGVHPGQGMLISLPGSEDKAWKSAAQKFDIRRRGNRLTQKIRAY